MPDELAIAKKVKQKVMYTILRNCLRANLEIGEHFRKSKISDFFKIIMATITYLILN